MVAAVRAGLDFAATDPGAADVLTNEALSRGRDGLARYNRLVAYLAGLLHAGRADAPPGVELTALLERALAGGILTLIARRLDEGRAAELPEIAPAVVQFVLTPYIGAERAIGVAGELG